MALRAILGAAARRRTTTLLAAASSPTSLRRAAVAFPFGVLQPLPSRVIFFPEQRIPVRIHVAAALSSAAGEEGKKLDGSSGDGPAAIRDLHKFIAKQLANQTRDHARILGMLFEEERRDRRKNSRHESNRHLIYTIIIAIVTDTAGAFVLDVIGTKKNGTGVEEMEAAGSGTGAEDMEAAGSGTGVKEVAATGSSTGTKEVAAISSGTEEPEAAGSGTGAKEVAATGSGAEKARSGSAAVTTAGA